MAGGPATGITVAGNAIALDATHVFVAQAHTVLWTTKGHTGANVILNDNQHTFNGIGVDPKLDATTVFLTATGTPSLLSVPVAGGSPTIQDTGNGYAGRGIAVDSANVYWSDQQLKIRPISGGQTNVVSATSSAHVVGVATDGLSFYWTEDTLGLVSKMAVGAGPPYAGTPVSLASGGQPQAIALDATNVYWVDSASNSIKKVPKSGGQTTTLASGGSPLAIAVDATNVYWTDFSSGNLLKVAK